MRHIFVFVSVVTLAIIVGVGLFWSTAWLALWVVVPFIGVGVYDMVQPRHAIRRNFPLLGRMRYLLEGIRPEIHQYFIESNSSGRPFDRRQRSLAYQRAKNVTDTVPFGTELDVYEVGYEWMAHSIVARQPAHVPHRVRVGGPDCKKPYESSLLNISGMSYGSLSKNAILALNTGAKRGGFAHNTGEGGISPYHQQPGGDLIWQIGTGYFGCRAKDGGFDPAQFQERATLDQVRMIELKISQGAKPGHGGMLPGHKVNAEVAKIRGVPIGQDVNSPPGHRAFSTPIELLEFVAQMRELSGGKPVGFKLCIGKRREFLSICKAMVETQIMPDFITVDGGEGGTGAAPMEFTNVLGWPLTDALIFVHNALLGVDMRKHVKVFAGGKVVSGFDMAKKLALGADVCTSARAMMFALGCIQAQECNTNTCPAGVATQRPELVAGLHVGNKSERVFNYHRNTVHAFMELIAAAGLDSPDDLAPHHVFRRLSSSDVRHYGQIYHFLEPGELLHGNAPDKIASAWRDADPKSFDNDVAAARRRGSWAPLSPGSRGPITTPR